MGRDKAQLQFGNEAGGTLLEHVSRIVANAAGNVTIVAPAERYAHLGLLSIPDIYPGQGPLAGIVTALSATHADWNLIVACDMPFVSAGFFERLFGQAATTQAQVVLPLAEGRPQPLAALYHRSALAPIQQAFSSGTRKVLAALGLVKVELWTYDNAAVFQNMNTPSDWQAALETDEVR